MAKPSIGKRYLALRIDEHGTKYLIRTALTFSEAQSTIDQILKNQEKAHHQTYDIVEYEVGSLSETLQRHEILR